MEAILALFAAFADTFVDVNRGDRFYKTRLFVAGIVALLFDAIAIALVIAMIWLIVTGSIFHWLGVVVFGLILCSALYIGYMGITWTVSLLNK